MTISRSEDLLVGLIALALIPLIGLRIRRGLRDRRLPLYRSSVGREIGPARFNFLLALHVLSLLVVVAIAADLLLGLGMRERL
jgi:hypothetical protein